MILDQELLFSDSQAVTASAASSNILDFGPIDSGNTYVDIGASEDGLWLAITVMEAFTDSGSDTTITPSWQTDGDSAFGSPVTLQTFDVLAALSPIGTQRFYRLPAANYERYNRLFYTIANGSLTTGKIHAGLVIDPQLVRYYATKIRSSVT